MAGSDYRGTGRLKALLLAGMAISVGLTMAVYFGYRRISATPERILATIPDGSDLSIGKIHQTATRAGKRQYDMQAGSAQYSDLQKQIVLTDLSVTFFLDDDSEIHMTASQGVLHTTSNDMHVSGNVIVQREDYRLTTDSLTYMHQQRRIYSKTPVVISAATGTISADAASFDLGTTTVVLEGNVEGTISENITL